MTAFIADDEPLARELLREYLVAHPEVDIVGEAGTGDETLAGLRELTPDLVFLDVQMPGLDGFDVLDILNGAGGDAPAVVFTTAYDQFAVRAFEAGAVDYLLKPFDRGRLAKALARVEDRLAEERAPAEALRTEPLRRLFVRAGERIFPVDMADVRWIEADADATLLHTTDESVWATNVTLRELAERLDPAQFARIHRSTIVSLAHLAHLTSDGEGGYVARLTDGSEVRVSRTYAARIRKLIR
ncbi:MAG: LytTR family DNA-binding domain-containing protein [Bacteroidota bacterium]